MSEETVCIRGYREGDLGDVLHIIADHDEDDAKNAKASLELSNCINWVALLDGEVVGISGYERVEGTDKTAYLSWTYVSKKYCGKGIGAQLLDAVIDHARCEGCRLMLIKVSDYIDPDTSIPLYARAKYLYSKKGFVKEIYCNDFYGEGEGVEILSLRLHEQALDRHRISDEKPRLSFCGLSEIAETNGAYTFDWHVPPGFSIFSKRNFSSSEVLIGLQAAKDVGARVVLLSFPSNLPLIHKPLQESGFKYLGEVKDYYEDGVHEMQFIFKF